MQKNITLKLDERLLNRVRHVAVDENLSISGWVTRLIQQALDDADEYERMRREALKRLDVGFHLGGQPLSRDVIHERR